MLIDSLIIKDPFKSLFPIDNKILYAIMDDIIDNGYDQSKPIDVWKDKAIVIDGHTRLEAARRANLKEIPIYLHEFKNEDEALQYAIHNQRDRRNMTDADIMRCVDMLDKKKQRGGDHKSERYIEKSKTSLEVFEKSEDWLEDEIGEELIPGNSAEKTAYLIGTSRSKIEKTRTIIDHADEQTKAEVLAGQKSINKAYNETQEKRKAVEQSKKLNLPVFNQVNENIEWAKWSWNPVTGCHHDCPYCYARDIAIRFSGHFNPEYHHNRLDAPLNTKLPDKKDKGWRNVFVCSMADLFGNWVPDEWINNIIGVVNSTPDWTYLFLTKNPKRYLDFDWPSNAWLGATIDCQTRVKPTQEVFKRLRDENRSQTLFISIEPFNESIKFWDYDDIIHADWVIIGGRSKNTKLPEFQPEWSWVETVMYSARKSRCKLYFKPNLTVRPKEYPE